MFLFYLQVTKVKKLQSLCHMQTQFIISLMEVYANKKDADSDVVVKSNWILEYIQEITASIAGQKKRKQTLMKSGEYSTFSFFVYFL